MFKGVIQFGHELLEKCVYEGEIVVDATCGNGNDTLRLSELVGNSGHVYAFDIQEQAIENTKKLLTKHNKHHVTYVLDSHANIDRHITEKEIAGAIFNLGYLPRSDKKIITKPDSTITAIEKILSKLKIGGVTVLVIYSGHPGGEEEKTAVLDYVSKLDQELYTVLQYRFINLTNNPPFTIAIYKK